MKIILNHYPNKPQYTHQKYIFACFCNLCKFHSSCSALQVEFSTYNAAKGKSMHPNYPLFSF